jgi:hypothetical protein
MTARNPKPPVAPEDPVAAAKAVALKFQGAVVTRQHKEVHRLGQQMTWEVVFALAVVLAEGIGQDATILRRVTLASDEEAGAA